MKTGVFAIPDPPALANTIVFGPADPSGLVNTIVFTTADPGGLMNTHVFIAADLPGLGNTIVGNVPDPPSSPTTIVFVAADPCGLMKTFVPATAESAGLMKTYVPVVRDPRRMANTIVATSPNPRRAVRTAALISDLAWKMGSAPASGAGFRALAETSSASQYSEQIARARFAAPEAGALPMKNQAELLLFFAASIVLTNPSMVCGLASSVGSMPNLTNALDVSGPMEASLIAGNFLSNSGNGNRA
jgi:hypothetical protein